MLRKPPLHTHAIAPLPGYLFVFGICLAACWGCRENNPAETPLIDPELIGLWYNVRDTVGFEITTDGTMRGLDVDSTGRLEYAPPIDTVAGGFTLTIESARGSAISIKGRYKSRSADSTYISTGTYTLSDLDNTLTLTLLFPINGGTQTTFVYQRSYLGAKVISRGTLATQSLDTPFRRRENLQIIMATGFSNQSSDISSPA